MMEEVGRKLSFVTLRERALSSHSRPKGGFPAVKSKRLLLSLSLRGGIFVGGEEGDILPVLQREHFSLSVLLRITTKLSFLPRTDESQVCERKKSLSQCLIGYQRASQFRRNSHGKKTFLAVSHLENGCRQGICFAFSPPRDPSPN